GRGRDRLQTTRVAAHALGAFGVNRDVSELARKPAGANPEFAVNDDCAADAVTDCRIEHIAAAASRADLELAIGRSVRVILKLDAQARRLHQLRMNVAAHD